MRIELLYVDGCPSHASFLPTLRALLDESGVCADIEQRRVETPDAAVSERFLGSPTLRIDGRDIEPGASERTDYGMNCRLYCDSTGLHGTPPERLVRQALYRATPADGAATDHAD